MEFIDTHCHIHFPDYKLDSDEVAQAAIKAGVTRMICVGCSLEDSQAGVEFAASRDYAWASIGLHPHEAHHYVNNPEALEKFVRLADRPKVVAIGETGLDYYYNHSPRESQLAILEFQLDLAQKHDLPLIFHVRDAFDDFWPVLDNFKGIKGVIHSFTAHKNQLEQALKRDLYIGLNGIMTFTKDNQQLEAAKAVPLDSLVLETDAPFLTPVPFRGKICEPKYVKNTAEFLSNLRGVPLEKLAAATSQNASKLFRL